MSRPPAGTGERRAGFGLMRAGLLAMALAATASRGMAQAYRNVSPTPPPAAARPAAPQLAAPAGSDCREIAVATLRGVVFAAPGTNPLPSHPVSGTGLPVLDDAFLASFEADIGRRLTFGWLTQIRRAVVQRYRDAGLPLVDVYVPEQDVSDGVVRIVVATYRLGKVVAKDNRYFSERLLVGEMPLATGQPIREADVLSGLSQLNANPYRTVDAVYAPGTEENTTDVVLQTVDRLPLRVSAGYDNAGVPSLGRDRFFAGINYGNLFGLDQQIGYQATASNDLFGGNPQLEGRPDKPRFVAHSLSYSAPLPWHDRVEIFGVYAQSTPRLPESYAQSGVSAQLSARYDWLIGSFKDWQQQIQFGYDFKRSNNDLEFGGFHVFNGKTHIHQFVLVYDATRLDTLGDAHANVTLVLSRGHLDADNNEANFNAARFGATPRYAYVQLSAQRDVRVVAGFSLSARATVQLTPNTLLPSEELGLGGDTSVRGYEPYAVLGDRGWNVQAELRTPAISLGATGAALQPYLFLDAGHVWNRIDQPTEASNGSRVGVGAGVRFQLARYVNFRGTYGVSVAVLLFLVRRNAVATHMRR
ncbi:hemolysin activation/secretion protein [Paraburkholderia sp. MM6662-R1]